MGREYWARRRVRWLAGLLVVAGLALMATACGDGEDATDSENAAAEEVATTEEEVAPTVDAAQVESALKKNLDGVELLGAPATFIPTEGGIPQQTQVGGGKLDVRSVSCPDDVPLEKGGEFTCDLEGGKQDASVAVKQLDDAGKRASFKARFKSPAGPGVPVETEIEAKIKLG